MQTRVGHAGASTLSRVTATSGSRQKSSELFMIVINQLQRTGNLIMDCFDRKLGLPCRRYYLF